jgi:E3 ubiquitin-protein ligase RNF14
MSAPKSQAAAVGPNPNPAQEYPYNPYGAEVPVAVADGAADALLRLDVSSAAAEDAPVDTAPPPQSESPAPPYPPLEASSSASAAAGGGREEEALRRLQELVGIGPEKVELTEDEARANDQRQEDEVMR